MKITKKSLCALIMAILSLLFLFGCRSKNVSEIIIENKNNLLMIDLGNNLDPSFESLCEITDRLDAQSNKRYKFIVLSEKYAETLRSVADANVLQEKILDGYYLIYPQTEKDKLNRFMRLFHTSLSPASGYLRGVSLKRDINFATFHYYIQATSAFGTSQSTDKDYILSVISDAIAIDEPNRNTDVFLGVYISESVYRDSDFQELKQFESNTDFDEFDAFNNTSPKKFSYSYDANERKIFYSIRYEIGKDELPYLKPYYIVRDCWGNKKAIPLQNSTFAHTGAVYTYTMQIPIYTGIYSAAGNGHLEFLDVTFDFVSD